MRDWARQFRQARSAAKRRRREEVRRVREEGRAAALAGKHPDTNPYRFMSHYQWFQGFMAAKFEMERED